MANFKIIAEKLKLHGYEYFVIDTGWFGEFMLKEGTNYPSEEHPKKVQLMAGLVNLTGVRRNLI